MNTEKTYRVINHETSELAVVRLIETEMSYYAKLLPDGDTETATHSERLEWLMNNETIRFPTSGEMTKIAGCLEFGTVWLAERKNNIPA